MARLHKVLNFRISAIPLFSFTPPSSKKKIQSLFSSNICHQKESKTTYTSGFSEQALKSTSTEAVK
jgi:hypothetical protein